MGQVMAWSGQNGKMSLSPTHFLSTLNTHTTTLPAIAAFVSLAVSLPSIVPMWFVSIYSVFCCCFVYCWLNVGNAACVLNENRWCRCFVDEILATITKPSRVVGEHPGPKSIPCTGASIHCQSDLVGGQATDPKGQMGCQTIHKCGSVMVRQLDRPLLPNTMQGEI